MDCQWAEENTTFTSLLNSTDHYHESEFTCGPESTIYSALVENTDYTGLPGPLDLAGSVNDGSDYLFVLNDSFTVPQVDFESFTSQWPFLPPGRSSDCYPPPTALQPEFSNGQQAMLNQPEDDEIFNRLFDTGLENSNLPFLETDLRCSAQKTAVPGIQVPQMTLTVTFTSQKI